MWPADEVPNRRHSISSKVEIIDDPLLKAEAEARNGLRQFDSVRATIEDFIPPSEKKFKLRSSLILSLHNDALEGISSYAGNFRPGDVQISGSSHSPVKKHLVAGLVEELCDYVNENWRNKTALHLAAYVMWRLNWIHPFEDGNGRTSRAVSYVVLNIKIGYLLPGVNTIPEQIVLNREPYFEALEAADAAWKENILDLTKLELLLEALLSRQLLSVLENASGKEIDVR
jgi:Fic family protein